MANSPLVSSVTFKQSGTTRLTTTTDSSRWLYQYDTLGQVTLGKRYWSDGTIVAGQQFEYGFDDIGNRKSAASGGDQWGANLRYAYYSANNLNQYMSQSGWPWGWLITRPNVCAQRRQTNEKSTILRD